MAPDDGKKRRDTYDDPPQTETRRDPGITTSDDRAANDPTTDVPPETPAKTA